MFIFNRIRDLKRSSIYNNSCTTST